MYALPGGHNFCMDHYFINVDAVQYVLGFMLMLTKEYFILLAGCWCSLATSCDEKYPSKSDEHKIPSPTEIKGVETGRRGLGTDDDDDNDMRPSGGGGDANMMGAINDLWMREAANMHCILTSDRNTRFL